MKAQRVTKSLLPSYSCSNCYRCCIAFSSKRGATYSTLQNERINSPLAPFSAQMPALNISAYKLLLRKVEEHLGIEKVSHNKLIVACCNIQSQLSDWYSIKRNAFRKAPGAERIIYQFGTMEMALKELHPEYPWDHSNFLRTRTPSAYWKDWQHVNQALESAEQKLGIVKVNALHCHPPQSN